MLKKDDIAPSFSLPSADGQIVKLDDLVCKGIVLYFYPKDDTPGCSQEAKDFRDLNAEFCSLDIKIIGVSKDSTKSHKNFKTRYNLPFDLLSDAKTEVIKSYGAWVEKSMFGKTYFGIERCTFFINQDREIKNIWRKVKVKNHAKEVLEYINGSA